MRDHHGHSARAMLTTIVFQSGAPSLALVRSIVGGCGDGTTSIRAAEVPTNTLFLVGILVRKMISRPLPEFDLLRPLAFGNDPSGKRTA